MRAVAWLLFPLIGAVIGWSTNVVAIRLLFRPRRPVRILGLTLQGLLPRRHGELAEIVGQVVERELLRRDDLVRSALTPAVREQVSSTVVRAAGEAAFQRLPAFLPAGLRLAVAAAVRSAAAAESSRFTEEHLPALAADFIDGLDIAGMIRNRILSLDLAQLEALAYAVARRELRHIEWLGAVLGALVGLAQAALVAGLRAAGFH